LQESISLIVLSQCRRRKEQNHERNDRLFHISSFSSGQSCILQARVIFTTEKKFSCSRSHCSQLYLPLTRNVQ
jgi:hypothetical protein